MKVNSMNKHSIAARKNINSYNKQERQVLAKTLYETPTYFENLFGVDQLEFACASYANAFRQQIERLLFQQNLITKPVPLEELHLHLSEEMKAYNFQDGINKISTYFYDTDAKFTEVYHQFIKFIRENIVDEHFWFQATPTIRIHCPEGKNADLYPRYHTDICYGHPPEELNIWFPLTEIQEGHGFSLMSLANSKKVMGQYDFDYPTFIENATVNRPFSDYCDSLAEPVSTDFGNVLFFDPRCVHSGQPIKAHTRISFDIRILPTALYEKMDIEYQGLGRRKILFAPGHCYHAESSAALF